jgi:hypothetical protein
MNRRKMDLNSSKQTTSDLFPEWGINGESNRIKENLFNSRLFPVYSLMGNIYKLLLYIYIRSIFPEIKSIRARARAPIFSVIENLSHTGKKNISRSAFHSLRTALSAGLIVHFSPQEDKEIDGIFDVIECEIK